MNGAPNPPHPYHGTNKLKIRKSPVSFKDLYCSQGGTKMFALLHEVYIGVVCSARRARLDSRNSRMQKRHPFPNQRVHLPTVADIVFYLLVPGVCLQSRVLDRRRDAGVCGSPPPSEHLRPALSLRWERSPLRTDRWVPAADHVLPLLLPRLLARLRRFAPLATHFL